MHKTTFGMISQKSNEPTKNEKFGAKLKTMRFLSIAALAWMSAMMTGCTSDDDSIVDNSQQIENTNKKVVTLTTTVELDAGATTRALTGGGVKTFAVGEQMAVVYNNGTSTVKAVSRALKTEDITYEGKTASFSFDLETPNTSVDVTYIYPAAMAKADGSVNYEALATQDGTLDNISSNLDLATKTAAWDGTALPSCQLANPLAILALTLKNNAATPTEITGSITGVTVKAGANTYAVTRSAAAGPIYVAIQPIASEVVVITATGGSKNYVKLLTGKTYEMGNGYGVTWKMTPIIPFGDATANDVGRVIAADGNVYDNATIATAVSTTAVAIISYVGNAGDAEVGTGSYRGLAIGMSDAVTGRVAWSDAASAAGSNNGTVVPGGTSGWFLPSVDQLGKICQGLASKKKGESVTTGFTTSDNSDYTANYLNSVITAAGGTGLNASYYWTSTGVSDTNAWAFSFTNGKLNNRSKLNEARVRSAIAF